MSSTNKTEELGLNQWVGTDVPKMEDFNNDNALIDKAISDHIWSASAHVTMEQKRLGAILLTVRFISETVRIHAKLSLIWALSLQFALCLLSVSLQVWQTSATIWTIIISVLPQ